jgi:cell wall-associated NlpC family hydrolase
MCRSFKTYFIFLVLALVLFSSCATGDYHTRSGRYSKSRIERTQKLPPKSRQNHAAIAKAERIASRKEIKIESDISDLRLNIVATAHQYIGKPYKMAGKKPETGFDCSGFTSFVFSKNGVPLYGSSGDQAKAGVKKKRKDILPGDLVFFGSNSKITHVAIAASKGADRLMVIHSTTSAGVKTDTVENSDYWEKRFLFASDVLGH